MASCGIHTPSQSPELMSRVNVKVAFLSLQNALPWGGSEELWSRTTGHLLNRGHRVGAMVYRWPEMAKPVRELAGRGCEIHTFHPRPMLRQRLLGKLGLPGPDSFAWLDSPRPDLAVVSVIGHNCGLAEMEACRTRRLPYLLIVQAASEPIWPGDDELDRLHTAYTQAVAVCFVSDGNRQLVERQFGRPLPNACIVRNPFNIRYDANPAWPDMSSGLRLACVGRFDPHHKGQDLIVEVFNRPQWRERQLSVTLVGRGPSESGLRRLVEWRKAAIHFQAFTNDIEQVWATHHALILPSRAEGLPLALVEALLCNRMAIVTDVAGNAEMVEEGVTGFVAPAPTVDLLDAALERAWARRAEWQTMGAEAGRRVRNMVPPDPASVFADFVEKTAAAIVH
jgi:glycosyltransferase involved in cell wall biosynthesis